MVYNEIKFEETTHTYTDEHSKQYISVTTLIDEYKKKYDRDFWCMFTALKEGGYKIKPFPEERKIAINGFKYKVDDIKNDSIFKHLYTITDAKWKMITEEALLRGNNTHNYLETTINKSKNDTDGSSNYNIQPKGLKGTIKTVQDLDKTDLEQKYPFIYHRLKIYIEKDCTIYAEKRVHLPEYLIAGSIDVPIFKNNTNKFCITDWKTNKNKLNKYAGYYKKRKIGNLWVKTDEWVYTDEKFLYPINHLEASKFNIYTLQLSSYAYILEKWGYKLVQKGLEIIHIRPGETPELIKIPYLKHEVELIFNHRKTILNNNKK